MQQSGFEDAWYLLREDYQAESTWFYLGRKVASGDKKMRISNEHRRNRCLQLGSRGERSLLGRVFLLERFLQRGNEPSLDIVDIRQRVRRPLHNIFVGVGTRKRRNIPRKLEWIEENLSRTLEY